MRREKCPPHLTPADLKSFARTGVPVGLKDGVDDGDDDGGRDGTSEGAIEFE